MSPPVLVSRNDDRFENKSFFWIGSPLGTDSQNDSVTNTIGSSGSGVKSHTLPESTENRFFAWTENDKWDDRTNIWRKYLSRCGSTEPIRENVRTSHH